MTSEEIAALPLVIQVRLKARSDETGIYSRYVLPDGTTFWGLERPRDNKEHPPIPGDKEYIVVWTEGVHPKHPQIYEITNVVMPDGTKRTAILMHSANWFEELEGCQAIGTAMRDPFPGKLPDGTPVNHKGIALSEPALHSFEDHMGRKDFRLRIVEA